MADRMSLHGRIYAVHCADATLDRYRPYRPSRPAAIAVALSLTALLAVCLEALMEIVR